MVAEFNRIQTDEIRRFSDAPISHNYMGRVTDFDHFATGRDLDIATWDSYPIGFLSDRIEETDAFKLASSSRATRQSGLPPRPLPRPSAPRGTAPAPTRAAGGSWNSSPAP